jgi:hypothetical protein
MQPDDHDQTAALLQRIADVSPFEPGGSLSAPVVELLQRVDAPVLGVAITSLVRHAAKVPAADSAVAADAIREILAHGASRPGGSDLQVPELVAIYRDVRVDDARQPISDLIVELLRSADRDEVMRSIGSDAGSLSLRADLTRALEGSTATRGPSRGFDFDGFEALPGMAVRPPELTEPPPTMAEPPAMAAAAPPPLAPPATAAPPAPPQKYRAYGLLESDETVLVGREFPLTVGLSERPQAGVAGAPLQIPVPSPQEAYTLDVQLFADGFDLAAGESWRHGLPVSTQDLFPTTVVHLTARDLPEATATRTITATYSINGETLGAAIRQITVTKDESAVDAVAAPTATGTNITAPTGQPPADVTITIKRGIEVGALLWGIESPLPGVGLPTDKVAKSDLGKDPETFMTEVIQVLFVQGSQTGTFQNLQGIARTVQYEMPKAVWDALKVANAAVAPRRLDILLLTEEPYVPWELAFMDELFDTQAVPYLGAQVNIGRWVLDEGATPTDPPRHVEASSMAVVWGEYVSPGLPRLLAAEEEAKEIQGTYKAKSVDAKPDPVYSLLGGIPPSDIVHFAVHGKYNPQSPGNGIYLVEGPPIGPFGIRGSDLKKRRPFVFLNACQIGAANNVLGSYGGIAQAFLQIGASAVVAPLWSIDDKIAKGIALKFYEGALAPSTDDGTPDSERRPTVADLLREARSGLMTDAAAQSSTYLAYQFYGHPSLRLTWNPPAEGGSHDG